MTLFEYVLRKYIGPPRGRSWSCPRHSDQTPSMIMQSSPVNDKHRCKCYSCGFWGDVFDILKIFHPLESFPERQLRLKDLEKELSAMQGNDGLLPQGTPEARHAARVKIEAGLIWADYRDNDGFELLSVVAERCKVAGITVENVIAYEASIQAWITESDQQHRDECDDADCDARICRSARGLPPLSPEEIKRDREQREQAKREQQARITRALRKTGRT